MEEARHTPLERGIWSSRFLMIVAVVASLVVALLMLYIATVDVIYLLAQAPGYASPGTPPEVRAHVHGVIVARVAEIVDGYLFAAIMIIFGLGLYELFINRSAFGRQNAGGSSVLVVRDIDDLKERLAKLVFLILLVRYFEYALDQPVSTALELLYLAIGIALVAVAIYLTSRSGTRS